VTDREQLARLIEQATPLRGVIHAAGVLDDATLARISEQQIERVLAPKIDAGWHLHELTAELELEEFVLFSSAAGVLGSAGQGAYGAANAFLDALAEHRHALGLPAQSLAWGLWEDQSEMTGHLSDIDRQRLALNGIRPLTTDQGLALLDRASQRPTPTLAPIALDRTALRNQARSGTLPPMLRGLIRAPAAGMSISGASLAVRVLAAPERERDLLIMGELRTHVAAVLGQPDGSAIDPQRAFKELGLDSLSAVDLRNRLATATRLRLPPTLVFDHPTVAAVAEELHRLLAPALTPRSVEHELDDVEARLVDLARDAEARLHIDRRMRALLKRLSDDGSGGRLATDIDLELATADDLVELLDRELGGAE